MRKTIAILFISTIIISMQAQEPLTYNGVVKVDGASKEELYNRARIWFAKAFVNSKEVLQSESEENGQLIGKAVKIYDQGFLSGSKETHGRIIYTASIFVKDGRYKYIFTDLVHESYGSLSLGLITTSDEYPGKTSILFPQFWYDKVWNDIKKQMCDEVLTLIGSLKQTMGTKAEAEKENW